MNNYELANLLVQLIAAGLHYKVIEDRLAAEQAKGTPEMEVPTLLRKWRDEARQAAINAQPEASVAGADPTL